MSYWTFVRPFSNTDEKKWRITMENVEDGNISISRKDVLCDFARWKQIIQSC